MLQTFLLFFSSSSSLALSSVLVLVVYSVSGVGVWKSVGGSWEDCGLGYSHANGSTCVWRTPHTARVRASREATASGNTLHSLPFRTITPPLTPHSHHISLDTGHAFILRFSRAAPVCFQSSMLPFPSTSTMLRLPSIHCLFVCLCVVCNPSINSTSQQCVAESCTTQPKTLSQHWQMLLNNNPDVHNRTGFRHFSDA